MSEKLPSFKPLVQNNENQKDKVLANSFEKIITLFENITEFNNRELKNISLLLTNKYYAKLLSFYILNKKHLKRKYAKEIILIVTEFSKILSSDNQEEQEKSLLKRLRGI